MLRLELPADLNWKNQSVGRLFLEHAVLIADIMVAFELACRSRSDVRLLDGEQLPLPENAREQDELFHWRVTLGRRQQVGVVPDRVFALEFTQSDQPPAYFFLEADRATMPVTRQNLSRSSFQRKLLAYHATWKQGLHKTRFGFPRFRVLTVTTSAERMQSMIDACSELEGGHGLFLFAEAKSLLTQTPLSAVWQTSTINRLTPLRTDRWQLHEQLEDFAGLTLEQAVVVRVRFDRDKTAIPKGSSPVPQREQR